VGAQSGVEERVASHGETWVWGQIDVDTGRVRYVSEPPRNITGLGSPPYDTWRCRTTVASYDTRRCRTTVVSYDTWRCRTTVVSHDGPEVSYDGSVV